MLTDQIVVLENIETKESLYYEYWYLFFDLQWMIFKRISVLNLGGIYCENKNKSHTKFKMFLCMKNPNENILHFILSLKFLFKNVCCCISLFLSMQLQFQYYIIRGIYRVLKLIKLKKPVQTVFSLSKYCLQIGLQWLLISWFHYKILACLDKIMPIVHPFQQHILSHCSSNGNQISCLCSGKILYS